MVDINDDTKLVRRRAEVTAVVRRRQWSDKEKGRIVGEAIAPGAVAADVARRHDLAPQQLWNWMRAARQGRFVLPVDGIPAFVPAIQSSQEASASMRVRKANEWRCRRLLSPRRSNERGSMC